MNNIKKIYLILVVFLTVNITGCKKDNIRTIKLAEVTHSVFYAPQYVAIHHKIFEKYNIKIDLMLTPGADKVMASLLSNDVDLGLMGPEASIYVYTQGKSNYAINFLQLTQKDGSFLVGREKVENFDIKNINNAEIIAGRRGGMPMMTLEYVLNQNGIETKRDDKKANVNLRTDVQFNAMAGAFISGEGDYVTLFEPTATQLENNNQGYILASIGELAGDLAYTCYSATKEYIKKNESLLIDFSKAIDEAIQLVYNSTDLEIAKIIQPSFTDISLDDLTKVVKRYKDIEAWPRYTLIEEESIDKIISIMHNAKEINNIFDCKDLINKDIINKAISKRSQ